MTCQGLFFSVVSTQNSTTTGSAGLFNSFWRAICRMYYINRPNLGLGIALELPQISASRQLTPISWISMWHSPSSASLNIYKPANLLLQNRCPMCILYPGTNTGTADTSSWFLWRVIVAGQIPMEQIYQLHRPISLQPEALCECGLQILIERIK